jgi:hypothetical protein
MSARFPGPHGRKSIQVGRTFADDVLPIEVGARDGKIDSAACGVLGCLLNARTDTDEVDRSTLGDNRPLGCAVLQKIDAGPSVQAASGMNSEVRDLNPHEAK